MNSFLNGLLDKQHVKKRKYYGPQTVNGELASRGKFAAYRQHVAREKLSKKPAFRPSGIIALFEQNSRIIEKIKQEPVRINHRKNRKKYGKILGNTAAEERNDSGAGYTQAVRRERWFPSLAVSAISFTALFALVLGIFFVIYSQGGSLDWTGREVVSSTKDQGSQYNLALYAGVNPAEKNAEPAAGSGETIPLDLNESFAWLTYKVRRGDSVSKIAAAFSVSMDAIIASNGITNARALREGETLRIPNMDGIPYTVKSGDSLSKISRSMGVPLEAILDANDIQSDVIMTGMTLFIPGARMKREDLRLALGELFIYPLRGARLSSPFGWRDDPFGSGVRLHHAAVDLSAPRGTPIKAAMEGRVSAMGSSPTYGNFIILKHPGEFETMYAHLNTFSVKKGDQVNQGAQIGTVGDTGRSTGPHLHFAIFRNGRAVNPLDFLNARN